MRSSEILQILLSALGMPSKMMMAGGEELLHHYLGGEIAKIGSKSRAFFTIARKTLGGTTFLQLHLLKNPHMKFSKITEKV
ncbi:MAG: hypothetical protein U0519_03665 [Candidatus Gracilibacteria bacterium]